MARILVVEDNEPLRRFIYRALHRQGHAVVAAGDAAEALRLYDQIGGGFHLLITDQILPTGRRGHELAEELVARDANLRVLLISGYAAPGDRVEILIPAARVSFLEKPFTAQRLIERVEALLR